MNIRLIYGHAQSTRVTQHRYVQRHKGMRSTVLDQKFSHMGYFRAKPVLFVGTVTFFLDHCEAEGPLLVELRSN